MLTLFTLPLRKTDEKETPKSPLPHVTKQQAADVVARLFNLTIEDHSSIKELGSFDDRNFYLRGSLMTELEGSDISVQRVHSENCKPHGFQP